MSHIPLDLNLKYSHVSLLKNSKIHQYMIVDYQFLSLYVKMHDVCQDVDHHICMEEAMGNTDFYGKYKAQTMV